MTLDLHAQQLVSQIDKLYNTSKLFVEQGKWDQYLCKYDVTRPILYDLIYGQLIKDGEKIDFSPSVKAELWLLSQQSFTYNEKRQPNEKDTELLHKYYKSFLVKKHLLEKLPYIMHIENADTGKRITSIDLKL